MRTSARNMLQCTVSEVKRGVVSSEVILDVTDSIQLVAIITAESVNALALQPGVAVYALIKSSFVLLAPGEGLERSSARNVLRGTVAKRTDGPVNAEIVIDLSPGVSIAAIVTRESAASLDLKIGDPACAIVKASHVILARD
jgi:molybdenum-pterin binding domain